MFTVRLASLNDLVEIAQLMRSSMRALSSGFYNGQQTESAVRFIAVPDEELIEDGTYHIANLSDKIVACGGWSDRKKLFTGTSEQSLTSGRLDPQVDPARIRAMFVDPGHSRQGLGRLILKTCEEAVYRSEFRKLELMATLPGVPLYVACGFQEIERTTLTLPDGVCLGAVLMRRVLQVSAST